MTSNIGEMIRSYRKAHGIKQCVLAKMVGVHYSYISIVESGKRFPSISMLQNMIEILRMPISVTVKEKLKHARMKMGLSLGDFATISGLSYQHLAYIERDGCIPKDATLRTFARILGTDKSSLISIRPIESCGVAAKETADKMLELKWQLMECERIAGLIKENVVILHKETRENPEILIDAGKKSIAMVEDSRDACLRMAEAMKVIISTISERTYNHEDCG